MRKLVKCPKCGRLNPQKRTTCSVCNTDLRNVADLASPKEETKKLKVCPACGNFGEEGLKLCPKCGFQLAVESASGKKKTGFSRQGFYVQPVKSSLSEIIETAADSREESGEANPWVRGDVIRIAAIVVTLLVVLFFAARYCVNLT